MIYRPGAHELGSYQLIEPFLSFFIIERVKALRNWSSNRLFGLHFAFWSHEGRAAATNGGAEVVATTKGEKRAASRQSNS